MFWIVDVIVVLLLVLAVVRGVKKGFFNTSFGFVGTLIVLAVALAITAALTVVCYKFGAIDALKVPLLSMMGDNVLFSKLGVTSDQVAYYVALGFVAIVCFAVSLVLALLLNRKFLELVENWRGNSVFRTIDSILGAIINLSIVCVVILGAFAFVHAFNSIDVLKGADEVIAACPISSLIYSHNPLNTLFA